MNHKNFEELEKKFRKIFVGIQYLVAPRGANLVKLNSKHETSNSKAATHSSMNPDSITCPYLYCHKQFLISLFKYRSPAF